ncbi:DUF2149 domain-containing protein [Hydrocarboniclastica marina]|uniref:DUF2149 domain-containing protein n=1 Tax=Hydrocarboniclastica marina TaxID=2259620 RepID=A0A4P7XIX6_9ALTE|nr:DUF2149 domain-containing protein [Hydrocarboniclastica marina]
MVRTRNLTRSRFDGESEEPLGPLANLVDIMLVFACGLIAALFASSEQLQGQLQSQFQSQAQKRTQVVRQGQELTEMPEGVGEAGQGYESLGQVYRDPDTGKMILIGQ